MTTSQHHPADAISDRASSPPERADTTPKPKYFFFVPWPVVSGTGVNNVLLGLRDAAARFYDPVIVSTGWVAPAPGQLRCKLPTPTFPLRNLVSFWISFIPNLIKLRRLVRGAVVVNPHYIGSQYLPLAVLRVFGLCPPLIFSAHGSDITDLMAGSRSSRALCRWMLSRGDLIVACSKALASRIVELKPMAKVAYVWNAVSSPPQLHYPRPHANRYLVCVASFSFNKGHDILLEAFELVLKSFPELDLVLIGNNAPDREAVLADIQRRGLDEKVQLRVNVPHDDVWPWIQNAECLVLSSRNEALGLCLLEAALVHTPVVATAVGGVPEIVGNGERGLLCPSEDPGKLAAAIIETLSKPQQAETRTRRFYEFARKLTWDNALQQYRAFAKLP